jgi:hypothetical protein
MMFGLNSLNMEQAKLLFGFLLLILMASLCAIIAIGHVKQETSYGLPEIIGGLLVLAGHFAQWAFGSGRNSPPTPPAVE